MYDIEFSVFEHNRSIELDLERNRTYKKVEHQTKSNVRLSSILLSQGTKSNAEQRFWIKTRTFGFQNLET